MPDRAWCTADCVDQAGREGEKLMEDLKTTGKKENLDQLDNFPLKFRCEFLVQQSRPIGLLPGWLETIGYPSLPTLLSVLKCVLHTISSIQSNS